LTDRRVGVGVKNATLGAGGGQKRSAEGDDLGYQSAAQGGPTEPSSVGQQLGNRQKVAKCTLQVSFWLCNPNGRILKRRKKSLWRGPKIKEARTNNSGPSEGIALGKPTVWRQGLALTPVGNSCNSR